jgi:hypothetical protein
MQARSFVGAEVSRISRFGAAPPQDDDFHRSEVPARVTGSWTFRKAFVARPRIIARVRAAGKGRGDGLQA